MRADIEQQRADRAGGEKDERYADRESGGDQHQRFAEYHPQHARPRRAEREAHTELRGALFDRIRHQPIESKTGERQRQDADGRRQPGDQTLLPECAGRKRRDRRDAVDRQPRLDLL